MVECGYSEEEGKEEEEEDALLLSLNEVQWGYSRGTVRVQWWYREGTEYPTLLSPRRREILG